MPLKLLVSLHDVTPAHADRLAKAERLLTALGVDRVTYLLVPDFHGRWDLRQHPAFVDWCRAPRGIEVHWVLHGYFHKEADAAGHVGASRAESWLARTFLTDGEGEFLALGPGAIEQRIRLGSALFSRCLGSRPFTFVAPAWLLNDELFPVLKKRGFHFTEDHRRIYQVQTGRRVSCPVITWATRTSLRAHGSRIVCPALARHWRHRPVVRLALHPADFDHPRTVGSIESVLAVARRDRVLGVCDDSLFPVCDR